MEISADIGTIGYFYFQPIELSFQGVMLCFAFSLTAGILISFVYRKLNHSNSSLIVTLALLPMIIQSIIMIVNGRLGMGIAVLGAFSLVRFRSVPGTAMEILIIVFDMAIGLAAGAGHILFAVVLTVLVCVVLGLFHLVKFGEGKNTLKNLRIFIPEDLDYTEAFNDLFKEYTRKATLERVRTVNLGSLYELQYYIELKDVKKEKELLDKIRQRNCNLDIVCGKLISSRNEL
jgi:hypothetical protein